ncbi:MAG: aminoglycoside phosphotransferase [Pirellulaceae bacterium]|nr:MAG: aminoglycoside phosphotransferase [Pirellulaceae bacterium]
MREDVIDIEDSKLLHEYLVTTGRLGANEPFRARVLRGGVSNRTVLVEHPPRRAWVLKQALPKLRVEVDWYSAPERIEREWLGLCLLRRLLGAQHIPAPVFLDRSNFLLAMHAVPAEAKNWKQQLLAGNLHENRVVDFAKMLSTIHVQAWKNSDEWQPVLQDKTFFESLRLEPYYEYTAGQVPEAAQFLTCLVEETRDTSITAVHGDYSPKNILVYRDRMVLLDHEVIHWGDPAFDVGFAVTHLLSKAHHVVAKRRDFARSAGLFWEVYSHEVRKVAWWRGFNRRAARHLTACLLARVAGRSQLEYLSAGERQRQRQAVLSLIRKNVSTVSGVIRQFLQAIACHKEPA